MALHFAFPRAAASARGIGTAGLHSGIPHCRHRGAIGRLSVPVWLNGTSSPGRTAGRVPFLWAALRDAHPHRASPSNGGPHGAPEPGGSQGCCQGKKTTSAAWGRQPNSRLPLGRPQPLALAALLTSRAPRRAPAVPTLHPFPPPSQPCAVHCHIRAPPSPKSCPSNGMICSGTKRSAAPSPTPAKPVEMCACRSGFTSTPSTRIRDCCFSPQFPGPDRPRGWFWGTGDEDQSFAWRWGGCFPGVWLGTSRSTAGCCLLLQGAFASCFI